MQIAESNQNLITKTSIKTSRLLIVGPKPPPIGGSPLTVQAMIEELKHYPSVQVKVINTSPGMDVRKKMTGFNIEKVKRSALIIPQFLAAIGHCDAVLVFANDLFALTLAPLLLFIARLFRKPFFLKPVGAGLDLFINAQKKPLREYMLFVLRAADGILTQTRLLKEDLNKMGCTNVHYLPGCRPLPSITLTPKQPSHQLRMIFLGHITRLKGPLILLDALKLISKMSDARVTCDFYGPIHDEINAEFLNELNSIPNAHYCGVAEPGTGPQLISKYDVLVLPTYYDTEGHPGVLIEAMHVGVPVISTQIRTIPELITNGINGFLVPTQNSNRLANAILLLVADPALRKKMGEANYRKGQEFRADTVVSNLLKIIFPDLIFTREQP
jgi:glycosyltransferase involved in cell wall biosynthesis